MASERHRGDRACDAWETGPEQEAAKHTRAQGSVQKEPIPTFLTTV